ncbi:MAG TPA: helix-turn-helix domain-containing protein [Actinomycetes bacterium]|jgi:AcrR family transcriptional regulator|nr:helix-turn-helix domain-containing protein [Actinomycetes bacterium]
MSATVDRLRDPRQRQERATRILDVAAALLLRHGYRRVTVDDVAAGADIGKGTVYLHWKSREELFTAVFEREVLHAIGELLQALRQDPQLCLLHRFARAYFLAIMNRPLLQGFVLGDADLLGKLAQPRGSARDDRHRLLSRTYFELLAEHGLLRDDLDVDAIAYAFQATFEGFLQAEAAAAAPTTAGHAAAGLDQRADLLARTVQRAFESGRTIPRRAQQSLATAVIDLLTDLTDADRDDLGIAEA